MSGYNYSPLLRHTGDMSHRCLTGNHLILLELGQSEGWMTEVMFRLK